jgi:hypothetical protein
MTGAAVNTGRLNYDQPEKIPRETLRELLSSNRDDSVVRALLSMTFYEHDEAFVLSNLYKHARSERRAIRGIAMLCLGHAARIHRRIPAEPTIEIVKSGLADADDYVRGHAESAADDIAMFVPDVGRALRVE